MKAWFFALVLLATTGLPGWQWLTHVRDLNQAQARGQAAAARGQAAEAAYYLTQAAALSGRRGPTPTLLLALAQAQAQAGQGSRARTTYSQLLGPAVPPALGSTARQQLAVLLARQGQAAQALGLLRQALRLNPANLAARYDYEVLGRYLAGQPTPPPPAEPAPDKQPPPSPPKPKADSAAGAAGSSRQPSTPTTGAKAGSQPASPQPAPSGAAAPAASTPPQPGADQSATGTTAGGGQRPGAGPEQPLPSGSQPGPQRGLGPGASGKGSAPGRPGAEAPTEADAQLQTQRERLRAMSLTPAQARQLLEALRASEQQYLQQRPRSQHGPPPAPGQPTW